MPNRSRVLAFKIGGAAQLPPVVPTIAQVPEPPRPTASASTIANGKALYHRYCYYCHGDAAVSGGVVPDLRHSSVLGDAAVWASIVRKGALSTNGMIAFGEEVSARDAEAIRAYVIQRANEGRAAGASPPPSGRTSE